MLELLIGAILLAPIGGALLSGTRFRRAVLPCVSVIWLVASFTLFCQYVYFELDGLDAHNELREFAIVRNLLIFADENKFLIQFVLGLSPVSVGLLICAALVLLVESSGIKRPGEIVSTCAALFFCAVCLLRPDSTCYDPLLLVCWFALDVLAGCEPSKSSLATLRPRRSILCERLLRASPSVLALLAYLGNEGNDSVVFGFRVGDVLGGLAPLIRVALFVNASSGDHDRPSSRATLPLLCFALPAISLLSHRNNWSMSPDLLSVALMIGAGISALGNSSRRLHAIRNLQLAAIALAVLAVVYSKMELTLAELGFSTQFGMSTFFFHAQTLGFYALACQLPLLCIMFELIRNRAMPAREALIIMTTLMLVSGAWGQSLSLVPLVWAADTNLAPRPSIILVGVAIGQFIFCAALVRVATLQVLVLQEEDVGASNTPSSRPAVGWVLGFVGLVMPSIAVAACCFSAEWREDFGAAFHGAVQEVAGVTILTPVLLLGALAGWYFTKPARGVGDKIARWCRPISRLARNGWYIRPVVETCVSVPLRVASFLAAKLDARVIGASGENAWKKSVSDVGDSIETIRRLDVRYSTLCGLLAIVGMLLALWWGA